MIFFILPLLFLNIHSQFFASDFENIDRWSQLAKLHVACFFCNRAIESRQYLVAEVIGLAFFPETKAELQSYLIERRALIDSFKCLFAECSSFEQYIKNDNRLQSQLLEIASWRKKIIKIDIAKWAVTIKANRPISTMCAQYYEQFISDLTQRDLKRIKQFCFTSQCDFLSTLHEGVAVSHVIKK
ncbi:hypothetical protein HYV11_02515 [Candidatus Dependentiae bacterium]|nr:hypothetical protein [Candidatus Dependentiae bacterium]